VGEFALEAKDVRDPDEGDTFPGELSNPREPPKVSPGVLPPTIAAVGPDEAEPVVLAQRLGVEPAHPGGC